MNSQPLRPALSRAAPLWSPVRLALLLNVNVAALSDGTAQALLEALDQVGNGTPPEDTALGNPAVTLLLINEGAVIGVVPFDENGDRKPLGSDADYDGMDALDIAGGDKVGVTCALCHAKTDGSVVPAGTVGPGSVGAETDGVIAGGLDVGAIFAAADNPLAYLPLLQLQLDALEGATIGKGDFTGIASGGTVADATAAARTYLTGTFMDGEEEKRYYGTTSFDATPDGIGNATYFPPFFRTDLAAPWGHSGAFAELNDFNNLVYTVALDPTSLLTADGRAFLNVLAGPVGDEIADRYEAVLRDTGVIPEGMAVADVLPYVDVARDDLAPGSAAGPVGRRVSNARLADLAAYTDRLAAPPAPEGLDAALISQGETLFTTARADGGAGCAGCHTANPNQPVKEVIIPIATLYPGYGMPPVILDRSGAGLTPIQNSTAGPAPSYDDSVVVLDASVRGEQRGEAKPLTTRGLRGGPVFCGRVPLRIMFGEHPHALVSVEQYLVGVAAVAHFHARGAHRHARHGEAMGVRAFLQQPLHVLGGHVAFDGVAVDKGGVAGAHARFQTGFLLDGLQVLGLVHLHFEAVVAHVLGPGRAAAAARRFVHFQSAGGGQGAG